MKVYTQEEVIALLKEQRLICAETIKGASGMLTSSELKSKIENSKPPDLKSYGTKTVTNNTLY